MLTAVRVWPAIPIYIASALALTLWFGRGVDVLRIVLQASEVLAVLLILSVAVSKVAPIRKRAEPLLQVTRFPLDVIRGLEGRLSTYVVWLFAGLSCIVIAGAVSLVNAERLLPVIKFDIRFLMGMALVFCIIGVVSSQWHVRLITRALHTGAVLSVAIVLLGFFIPAIQEWTMNGARRVQGLVLNPNQFGIMLSAVTPIALANLVTDLKRLDRWFLTSILLIGLVLSGSKMNLLVVGALGSMTILMVSFIKEGPARFRSALVRPLIMIAVLGAVGVALLWMYLPRTIATLQAMVEHPMQTSTVSVRLDLWTTAFKLGMDNPAFGVGAENIGLYLPFGHAHNVVANFFGSMGFPGLVSLLVFIGSLLALCYFAIRFSMQAEGLPLSRRAQIIGLSLGCVSYVLSNQTSDSFGGTTLPVLWVLIGLLIASVNLGLRAAEGDR